MIEKIKTKFDLLFSMHYKIERFGIMMFSLVALLAILCGSVIHYNHEQQKIILGNQVMYTTELQFSMSGNTGTVENVYVSSDHTQAFVLVKWEDLSKLVTDVNEYEVFICGSDSNGRYETLLSHPSVGIYSFGASGYMGFYLVDGAGFPEQIINMTVRCNKRIGAIREDIPVYPDKSFNEYDQVKIFFNPGGSQGTVGAFLDENRMGIYDVIEGTIIDGKETELREKLDSDLTQMRDLLAQIDEYSTRLKNQGVLVPDAPIQIRGDKVVGADDNLFLSTDYVLAGGYTYDWRSGSIQKGYLDDVIPEKIRPTTYISNMTNAAKDEVMSVSGLVWHDSNGNVVDMNNPQNLQSVASLTNNINSLTTAWQDYFNLKKTYQTEDLSQLLVLELQVQDMTDNYGIKTDTTTTLY